MPGQLDLDLPAHIYIDLYFTKNHNILPEGSPFVNVATIQQLVLMVSRSTYIAKSIKIRLPVQ